MFSANLSLFMALHDACKNQIVMSDCGFTVQFDNEKELRHAIDILIGSVTFRYSVTGLKITVRGL